MNTYRTIEKSGKLTYIEFKIRFLRKNAFTAHSDAVSGNVKMNEEVKKKEQKVLPGRICLSKVERRRRQTLNQQSFKRTQHRTNPNLAAAPHPSEDQLVDAIPSGKHPLTSLRGTQPRTATDPPRAQPTSISL